MADPPPDNSIAWHLYVGCLTTGIPATIFVALRFFARHLGDIPLKADDWLIAGSLVWRSSSSGGHKLAMRAEKRP